MDHEPVVIIGAGPAGIATAVSLAEKGVRSVVIDREGQVAASWRGRYDRLKLDTNKWFSRLPGRPYPTGTPIFPTRDQIADYLERQAQIGGVVHRLNTAVERVDPLGGGGWQLLTSDGYIEARHVVVATGRANTPVIPEWPGLNTFKGELLHSSLYRNSLPFAGKRVLVIGSGASGMDIAHDLATGGAAKVWLAVRTPPNILLRKGPRGIPGDVLLRPMFHLPPSVADAILRCLRSLRLGDLSKFGLPIPEDGAFAAAHWRGISPSIIDMDVIKAVRRREIEVVQTIASVDAAGISLVDGTLIQPEVVIAATGYRPGLESMVGHLNVLDGHGVPQIMAPKPASNGLWFIGYQLGPSLLGIVGQQSRPLARMIANDLGTQPKTKDPLTPTAEAEGSKW
jgi:cation diffusion facilitator CzcD-associated flavoprotein CzcO